MERKELESRITKKEEQIKKIEKKIAKWENSKTQEACLKRYDYLLSWGRTEKEIINTEYENYLKDCDCEIRRAQRDLEESQLTLKKYQNMLQVELAKENELENNRIDVIWNFLLNYKEMVKDYVRNNLEWVEKYYEYGSQLCDWHNKNCWRVGKDLTREEYKAKENELRRLEKEAKENIHPYTSMVEHKNYQTNERYIDEEKLEEILTKDITTRYFQLIDQITKYTGKIQDASFLKIGAKGDLNGIVIGEEGKAKIETIGAGGYNVQCFHYRTLIHPIN